MWTNLTEDVADQFSRLEGCGTPRGGGAANLGHGFHIIDGCVGRSPPKTQAQYNERKRNSKRKRVMRKAIEAWTVDAQMICVGRELDADTWMQTLLAPTTEAEIQARTDFVYFMVYCRHANHAAVGKMLSIRAAVVRELLSSRAIK